jgi:hypothetical protein
LECKMSNIPDVGGICVKPGNGNGNGCRPCPAIACPLDQQVAADVAEDGDDTTALAFVANRCPRCPRCLPCCPPVLQKGGPRCRDCGFRG